MKVTLDLTPEIEAALRAKAEARGLTITQWLLVLAERDIPPSIPGSAADLHPAARAVLECFDDVPAEDWADSPTDGASQHDHYLYGSPKRTDL